MMLLGVMLHIVPLVIWMHRNLGGVCRSLYKRRQEFSRASAERRQAAEEERILREHPPQPPLPYSERLRQQLTSAEEQYHAEAGLIRSTDVLDATEREVALMHAKQRFLERLRGMLG